jgi:hypothetical protein
MLRSTGNKLKNIDDITLLYESASKTGQTDLFEKTAFTAKYINGLKRVISSGSSNPEVKNIEQIKKDLIDNYNKITEQMNQLISKESEERKEIFTNKYLEVSGEGFTRLNSLIDDLDRVKIFLNDQKRK